MYQNISNVFNIFIVLSSISVCVSERQKQTAICGFKRISCKFLLKVHGVESITLNILLFVFKFSIKTLMQLMS